MIHFANFPILLTVGTWFFLLACVPSLIPYLLARMLQGADGTLGETLGVTASVIYLLFSFLSLCLATPWFFRWHRIAAGLACGSTALADRKEAELVAAIEAVDPSS